MKHKMSLSVLLAIAAIVFLGLSCKTTGPESTTDDITSLAAPSVVSPTDSVTIRDKTPLLDWDTVSGAEGYALQLSADTAFSGSILVDIDTLTESRHQIGMVLDSNTTFYWRVRAKSQVGDDTTWSEWSSVWSFILEDLSEISGTVSRDTVWALKDSPFNIVGNLLVDEGRTLTIEPGVEVLFDQDMTLQINGKLIAKGQSGKPIIFRAFEDSLTKWGSISFADSSSASTLEYCQVMNGGSTVDKGAIQVAGESLYVNHTVVAYSASNGIYVDDAGLKIVNSTIRDCRKAGLWCDNLPLGGNITVDTCEIHDNGENGISVALYAGSGTFRHNSIRNNTGTGIGIYYGFHGIEISNNTIEGNDNSGGAPSTRGSASYQGGGITLSRWSEITITRNTIANNIGIRGGGIHLQDSDSDVPLSVTDNVIGSNRATYGGALYFDLEEDASSIDFSRNLVKNNTSSNHIIYYKGRRHENDQFLHNTIVDNVDSSSVSAVIFVTYYPAGPNMSVFNGNNLLNPGNSYELYNDNSAGSHQLDARNNWWGSQNESDIQQKIYDFTDDGAKEVVDYTPFLTIPDSVAPSIN